SRPPRTPGHRRRPRPGLGRRASPGCSSWPSPGHTRGRTPLREDACPPAWLDRGTVDSAAIVRGYEYGPGRHVIAQPDELDALRPVQDKALRLERFLTADQPNPLLFAGRSLYLVPDGPAAEPGYGVLRLALAKRQ